MHQKRSRPTRSVRLVLSMLVAGSAAGCGGSGSSDAGGTAAAISPAMKKKVDENLKGYAQRAAAREKARRSPQP